MKRVLIHTRFYNNAELIITFGHQSIWTKYRPFVAASGQVWPVVNVLVAANFFACQAAGQKKAKRQITKSTFEKWQKEHEIEHQTLSWLRCDLDVKGTHVVSLYCAVCRKYEDSLRSLKNFRRDWIVGSTNQRTSN